MRLAASVAALLALVLPSSIQAVSAQASQGIGANTTGRQPHLVYLLVDDFGWQDADWHRSTQNQDPPATPHMNNLIKQGIELDQHYAFKFCAPSRSSIQSGRNPIHVNVQNYQPTVFNWKEPSKDPDAGFAGIPRNMSTVASVLRKAGYSTTFAGKWDCGMATRDHTPAARGYDSSLFYFHHDNDYWQSRVRASDAHTSCPGRARGEDGMLVDLWTQNGTYDGPALGLNNSYSECNTTGGAAYPEDASCVYEDQLFLNHALQAIQSHGESIREQYKPLFLFWASHSVHAPLQVPRRFLDRFWPVRPGVDPDQRRARYMAMVSWVDDALGQLVEALDAERMLADTLIVVTSDNGGPVYWGGNAGANNFPLRGGKTSNFQGGIRVNAFVSGGVVPEARRGIKVNGLSAVWDWAATFADLAGQGVQHAGGGVTMADPRAVAAGLPPVDSLSLWPWLSGASSSSPRAMIEIGSTSCQNRSTLPTACINQWGWGNVSTIVSGVIKDDTSMRAAGGDEGGVWKLLIGLQTMSGWQGASYPNTSTRAGDFVFDSEFTHDCGETGCLFRIDADPGERVDLSRVNASMIAKAAELLAAIKQANQTTFSPDRGPGEQDGHITEACTAAISKHGGFWGPFLD